MCSVNKTGYQNARELRERSWPEGFCRADFHDGTLGEKKL